LPEASNDNSQFIHRRKALESFSKDLELFFLPHTYKRIDKMSLSYVHRPPEKWRGNSQCVFCAEFAGEENSVYHKLLGHELPCRIVYSSNRFVVFPPLGQFVVGGLLLATWEHILSFAYLPFAYYSELELLLIEVRHILQDRYNYAPLIFEHGPKSCAQKGSCCVDHAHFNIFPTSVDVHKHLDWLPHYNIDNIADLAKLQEQNQAYLFLQSNDGQRRIYNIDTVPSQYIRQIVTRELGITNRWHWRDYLGLQELKQTYQDLLLWGNNYAQQSIRTGT